MPKVMVVDDSSFMRKQLAKCLSERGYEVVLVENGEQATSIYRSVRPDLVLMDIVMPKMDGLEALNRIRLLDPRAKVVMLTAMEHKSAAARAVYLGATDFIVKPFLPSQVIEKVEKLLGRAATNLSVESPPGGRSHG